MKTMTQ